MPFPGRSWPVNAKVVATLFHAIAIVSGIFRSTYRWYISRFGWDDAWALLALVMDVGCLICAWVQGSALKHLFKTPIIRNWVAMVSLNSVPWEARLSMIASIIRITNPRASTRRMSYAIAIAFGMMWIAMIVQKSYACIMRYCIPEHHIAITQLTTDLVSDVLLVVTPIFFLKGIKVPRSQHMLLVSSFASSICITILSIAQSVSLFLPITSASLLFTHIKAALSVVICNLLVIVTFAYRCFHKTNIDLEAYLQESEPIQFTTVVPEELNL